MTRFPTPPSDDGVITLISSIVGGAIAFAFALIVRNADRLRLRGDNGKKTAGRGDSQSVQLLAELLGDCQTKVDGLEEQIVSDAAVFQEQLRQTMEQAQAAQRKAEIAQEETDRRLMVQADYIAELRAELDTLRGDHK